MLCDLNCPNLKCIGTGSCVDDVPVVEAPSVVPADVEAFRNTKGYCDALKEGVNALTMEADSFTIAEGPGSGLYSLQTDEKGYVSGVARFTCVKCTGNCAYRDGGYCSNAAPRLIIGLTGLAGSGKSTAAMHLVERHGFQRVRFAGPLKAMLAALGCTPAEIDGDRKEMPCELLGGKTPRWAMQTLGTEWGRNLIASDLWIRAWQHAVAQVPAGVPIVVDDCRFANEAAAIQAAGGSIIRIVRPGAGAGAAGHSSEGQALPYAMEIANDMAIGQLLDRISSLACDLSWIDHATA